MFTSLFSFSWRYLLLWIFKVSLGGQLHRPENTKCNALDLADCQNQVHNRKVFEWKGFLRLIYLDRLINHSYWFGKQPAASALLLLPWSGKCGPSNQQIYLKRSWPIHQFLRPILWIFLLPRKHLLFLLKVDAEAVFCKCYSK